MPVILNIDTATEHASVCISVDGSIVAFAENSNQKDHAAFIQPAIQQLFAQSNYALHNIDAIAVANGPGSYTGLRVGLSTAKGLCFALNKPLILINTLEIIASAAISHNQQHINNNDHAPLFCAMIDARRMEVFTALYDDQLNEILPPQPMILDETSFATQLQLHSIIFCGNGSGKLKSLISQVNAQFINVPSGATHMQSIAEKMYLLKSFADIAYSEPFYLKEFYNTQ